MLLTDQIVAADLCVQQFETCATGILREGAITSERKSLPFVHNNAALFDIQCSDLVERLHAILLTHLTLFHPTTISSIVWTVIFLDYSALDEVDLSQALTGFFAFMTP